MRRQTSGSPLTTKGDLYTYTTLDARLPVGSDGQMLYADSAQATGLRWGAAPSGAATATYIWRRNDNGQTVGSGAWIQVQFAAGDTVNTEAARFAIASPDADVTNVKLTGLYLIKGKIVWDTPFAALSNLIIRSSAWTYDVAESWDEAGGAAGEGFKAPTVSEHRRLPSGTSGIQLLVRQESGGNQDILDAMIEIAYIAAYSGQPANPDDW